MHPEGYQCFIAGCRTKCVQPISDRSFPNLTPPDFARIKRRSAFVKHVKAKHEIDLNQMSIEEAAAAAELIRGSPDVERVVTPPPDYTTATGEPMYEEEDLPTFSSGAMPKQENYTPPSVDTPPPAVIDVVPSSEGYRWSAGFVGTCYRFRLTSFALLSSAEPTAFGTGIVCGSPDPALLVDLQQRSQPSMLDMEYFLYPETVSQQPPSYYEQQWSGTTSVFTSSPLSVGSVATADLLSSSPSPCTSGADYNFAYDPNNYGVLNSQIPSLRDVGGIRTYMTPAPMTSFSTYSFA